MFNNNYWQPIMAGVLLYGFVCGLPTAKPFKLITNSFPAALESTICFARVGI